MKSRKRRKKSGRQIWIKKLDDLVREIVRKRDNICRWCGSTKDLQDAHIFSRKRISVRWDLNNHLLLCLRCHLFQAHREPIEFYEFVASQLGEEFERLKKRARQPAQSIDFQKVYDELKCLS